MGLHFRRGAYSVLSVASYGGLFVFLVSSSFVFIDVLGLSRAQYGLTMLLTSVAYISGTFLCRRLLRAALSVSGRWRGRTNCTSWFRRCKPSTTRCIDIAAPLTSGG